MRIAQRIIKRLSRCWPRYKTWEDTPTAWLLFFLSIATMPVVFSGYHLATLVPELIKISHVYGISWMGAAIWVYVAFVAAYAWIGQMVVQRCNQLIRERWIA